MAESDVAASIDDAFSTLPGRWTALLSSPSGTWFAVLEDGTWQPPPSLDVSTGAAPADFPDGSAWRRDVFEVRAFAADGEARWLKGFGSARVSAPPPDHGLEGRRLLAGSAVGPSEHGWTVMGSARIGTYPVPLEVPIGARVALVVREVLSVDEEGTVSVIDEVVVGFEVVTADGGGHD